MVQAFAASREHSKFSKPCFGEIKFAKITTFGDTPLLLFSAKLPLVSLCPPRFRSQVWPMKQHNRTHVSCQNAAGSNASKEEFERVGVFWRLEIRW
jgi:hypothetical protein